MNVLYSTSLLTLSNKEKYRICAGDSQALRYKLFFMCDPVLLYIFRTRHVCFSMNKGKYLDFVP